MGKELWWDELKEQERMALLGETPVSLNQCWVLKSQDWSSIPRYVQDALYQLDWLEVLYLKLGPRD